MYICILPIINPSLYTSYSYEGRSSIDDDVPYLYGTRAYVSDPLSMYTYIEILTHGVRIWE